MVRGHTEEVRAPFTILDCPQQHLMSTSQLITICHPVIMAVKFFGQRTMFDNGKAPHVHNKSIMCNFISIQSILLSHCELNTFYSFFFFAFSYKAHLSFFISCKHLEKLYWEERWLLF